MIPSLETQFLEEVSDEKIVSKDYFYDTDNEKINGTVEDIEAVKQAIYFMLNTERYEHIIYSWDYGVELVNLIGMPPDYVEPEAERVITECLKTDNRIEDVTDFEFEYFKKGIHITFRVMTIYGQSIKSEVDIDV